jgi:endonuclease/exonuclease/phosphatase family metal-dependent hydrolase
MIEILNKNKNDRFFNITQEKANGQSFSVMSWNFSFAYGVGSAGLNYYQKIRFHFIEALDEAVQLIKDHQVDIVLLQEVDFSCKKTHFIDQLEYMAVKLNFNFAYGTSWSSPYVPFPFFAPEDHFGKTNAGGGVLSRFPITSNTVHLLPKPSENFKIYNFFYPSRYFQTVGIKIFDKDYLFGNLHLEAFNIKNRTKQTKIIIKDIVKRDIDFFGGDFNTVPLCASKRSNFKDYESDCYVNDATLNDFYKLNYNEFCPEEEYTKNEEKWFTFPSNNPERRLDYLFFKKKFNLESRKVIDSKISDHFPIIAKFKVC